MLRKNVLLPTSSILAVALSVCCVSRVQAGELDVLPAESKPRQSLRRHLMQEAYAAFDRRSAEYESVKSAEDLAEYCDRRRKKYIEALGGFPKRTPLNAKVIGSETGEGHRLERIIFESRPRHYVTASLFLPLGKGPHPAVLVPCGHTPNGKYGYQKVCIFLARSGLAAFCYDPIGQGERYQFLDSNGKRRFKSTTEHTITTLSCIPVGRNAASYRIWDGMRALDYLETRPDIDSKRFGCTGNSGGGTLTEYLMALDPRIVAAAPGCCVTTFKRRFETIGPGDGEQNIYGQVAFGFDHGDYTILRAPQPTLLCTASQDFIDIEGSWTLFRETKRIYSRLGHANRLDLIETDAKHGFSLNLRVGVVRFMRYWLMNKRDDVTEPEIQIYSEKQVQCTPQGQAQLLEEARSVMDFNRDVVEQYAPVRKKNWTAENRAASLAKVRQIIGARPLAELPRPKVREHGTIDRTGYTIKKISFAVAPQLQLPALLFLPKKPSGKRILICSSQGKTSVAVAGGTVEKLVASGHYVLAVDVRGIGEIEQGTSPFYGVNFKEFFMAYLLGKNYVGMRCEDIWQAARYLSEYQSEGKAAAVSLLADGSLSVPALHAAALQPTLFHRLMLKGLPVSFKELVDHPDQPGQLVSSVHGALLHYDLADLVRSLPKELPSKVELIDAQGKPVLLMQ